MFSIDEKSAIVQCFWQLLSAKPTQEERDFVDKLTSTWGLSGSWVYVAIQQETYVAFKKVKSMNLDKRNEYLRLVSLIVNMGGNVEYKKLMFNSLMRETF